MTFSEYLESIDACSYAIEWAGDKTIEQVVADCHRGDWLLWLAQKCDIGLQPLTLAKGHCANTVRHLLKDDRSIKAVDTAIAFGEGTATREELDAAAAAAYAYAAYAADAAAARAAAAAAAYAASPADAADAAAARAAAAAAYAAAHASNQEATIAANLQQTADICRQYIGDLIIQKVNETLNPTQL
jgi:hypothetical protein